MNVYYFELFSSRAVVRIRFGVWLVSCYAHVFVLVSLVIVTLPQNTDTEANFAASVGHPKADSFFVASDGFAP